MIIIRQKEYTSKTTRLLQDIKSGFLREPDNLERLNTLKILRKNRDWYAKNHGPSSEGVKSSNSQLAEVMKSRSKRFSALDDLTANMKKEATEKRVRDLIKDLRSQNEKFLVNTGRVVDATKYIKKR